MAAWPYGLGKAVAFTTDDGARWTKRWPGEPAYDKLFGQMVRWAMRPAGGTEKFTTAAEVVDRQIRVVVNALDKNDEFLNFLGMTAMVVGPDLEAAADEDDANRAGPLRRHAAGASPAAISSCVGPGAGMAPIRTGVTVPYSDEFRDLATNDALLGQLAALAPKGGAPGRVIEAAGDGTAPGQLLAVNTFRHDLLKATSRQDIWHYLVLAACCLLFGDVFIRRVQVESGVGGAAGRPYRRLAPGPPSRRRRRRPPWSAAQPQGRGVRAVRSASRGRALRGPAGAGRGTGRLGRIGRPPSAARRRRNRRRPRRSRKKRVILSDC